MKHQGAILRSIFKELFPAYLHMENRVREIRRSNVWRRGKFSPDEMSGERKLSKMASEEITLRWTFQKCFHISQKTPKTKATSFSCPAKS